MKIMILGAGMLQAYVIKRAHELGFYTIAVDMDKNAVGFKYADECSIINIVDEEACLKEAKRLKIDGVLTAATDYGVLSASYISQNLGLLGIPYSVAQTVKNKYLVRKTVNSNGQLQFFEITDIAELENLRDKILFPIMVKPCDGSGSKGAGRVDSFDELLEQCQMAFDYSLSHKVLLETFLEGEEYGVESFVCGERVHILTVMKKAMTKPPYYAELGHSVPTGLPVEIENKIRQTAENAIKSLGINFGSVNMDIILQGDTPYIVDIGARMGGNLIGSHIVPIETGVDYIGNMIKAHLGIDCDFTPCKKTPVATALLALTPGKIMALPDFSQFSSRDGILDIVFNKQVGDTIRLYKNNLDGCGYVVASAKSAQEAHKLAFAVRDEIDRAIIRC